MVNIIAVRKDLFTMKFDWGSRPEKQVNKLPWLLAGVKALSYVADPGGAWALSWCRGT